MNRKHSFGPMLITAPSEHERLYEMAVRLSRQEIVSMERYTLFPWLVVRANVQTTKITLAAGITAKRVGDP